MQIRELEHELGAELVERRQGAIVLTEAGAEVARRARLIISATRDLADSVCCKGELLSGSLRLGVIPTLAPYLLPQLLPKLHRYHPDLSLDLLETQTKTLLIELAQGSLDVVLLALPIEKGEFETSTLFDDRFLLAVPADDPLPERAKVSRRDVNARRLVLLEEGHCLRDQALIYCGEGGRERTRFGATSLATVLQMVASGYGVTLLPEVAVNVEVRDDRVKLLRFVEPQPQRNIGLAWRPTSPRKADFLELGRIVLELAQARAGEQMSHFVCGGAIANNGLGSAIPDAVMTPSAALYGKRVRQYGRRQASLRTNAIRCVSKARHIC